MAVPSRRIMVNARPGNNRDVNAIILNLKRKARERITKILCEEQEESVRFLVFMRDNPNVSNEQRIRCALEILSRGEAPPKNASYLGTATAVGEMMDEPPKLVVLGQFKKDAKETSGGDDHAQRDGESDGERGESA